MLAQAGCGSSADKAPTAITPPLSPSPAAHSQPYPGTTDYATKHGNPINKRGRLLHCLQLGQGRKGNLNALEVPQDWTVGSFWQSAPSANAVACQQCSLLSCCPSSFTHLQMWSAQGHSILGPAHQGCAITSRKQGPHFSLLCACQSCHAHTQSAFIRTTVEHFYIDILIGGSLGIINNRPPQLIICKSAGKKSQARLSFHMTCRERKDRLLLQRDCQSKESITCESQILHTDVPTLGDCSTGNCFSIFHLPGKSCQEISTQTKKLLNCSIYRMTVLPRAADI